MANKCGLMIILRRRRSSSSFTLAQLNFSDILCKSLSIYAKVNPYFWWLAESLQSGEVLLLVEGYIL